MDMLHGSIADKLFFFAMPIGLMGLFEQLFNSADVFILGRFVGKSAMAAVGNNMPVIGILVMLLMGISLGANVTIAQYLGARRDDKVERTVQTAILMSFGLGALLAVIGELIVYPAFWVLEVPPDVYDMAEQYLRIFLLGLPFLSLYNFEAAIFRSCGDGKTPLYSLVAANIVNIVLDLLSVLVFDFGLAGVVWATVIAFAVNSLILLVLLCRTTDRIRLERHHMRFSREELHHIIRIGLPAGIQGMVFALSNVLIQSALNSLGTEAMAASAAAFIIEGNIYCFVNGFSQATTTFVGQNYGAGKIDRCKKTMLLSLGEDIIASAIAIVIVLLTGKYLLAIFNNDPQVIALGYDRLKIVFFAYIFSLLYEVMSGYLRGFGISLVPAALTALGVCGIRIAWIHFVFPQHPTLQTIMTSYPVSLSATALMIFIALLCYRPARKHAAMEREPAPAGN